MSKCGGSEAPCFHVTLAFLYYRYAEKAFKKLGIEFDVSDDEISEAETSIQTEWRVVVGAYAIRLALAPVMEAYILLDRMIYLHEQGNSYVVLCTRPCLVMFESLVGV